MTSWVDQLNPFSSQKFKEGADGPLPHLEGTQFQNLDEDEDTSSASEGITEDDNRKLGGDEGQTMICGLPRRQREVPDTVVGIIFALYPLMVFIFSPIVGKYLGVLGVRNVFIVGLFFITIGTVLFAFVDTTVQPVPFIAACCLIRLIQGFGAAFVETAAFAALTVNCPHRYMGKVFSILETCGSAGALLGPPIGGAMYQLGGFKLPFLIFGPLPAVIAVLVLLLKFDMEMEEEEEPAGFWEVLTVPWVWISSLVTIFTMSAMVFIEPTLAIHLAPFNLTPSVVGLMFVLTYAVYMVATPIVGILIDKFSKPLIMLIGLIVTAISYILLGPAPFFPFLPQTVYLNAVALGIMGVGACIALLPTLPLMVEAAHKSNPNSGAVVSGICSAAYSLGEVIGPPLGSFMVDIVGFAWASVFFAGLVGFSGILIIGAMISDHLNRKEGEKSPLIETINETTEKRKEASSQNQDEFQMN